MTDVLPPRTLTEVAEAYPTLRQSLLARVDNCMLSTLFNLEGHPFTSAAQARGIIFHRFAAECLRTLRGTGETKIPTEEALQILYEVAAQRDVPDEEVVVVPVHERRLLRILVVKFAATYDFDMRRLLGVEQRLFAPVTYSSDNGVVERIITGQPDALVGDPASGDDPVEGMIVLDWKTNLNPPPAGDHGEHWDDPAHVSWEGYFQQRTYGLLVMRKYPSVERVRLREQYVLAGVARYATVYRNDLDHIEREFALLAEMFDRAVAGGSRSPLWAASPGKHCAYCPRPLACPIPADVRVVEGGIASEDDAAAAAAAYVIHTEGKGFLHNALKVWVNENGPVPVASAKGRYEMRWKANAGGGRSFGLHVPEDSDRAPSDANLDQAFIAAVSRR